MCWPIRISVEVIGFLIKVTAVIDIELSDTHLSFAQHGGKQRKQGKLG